MHAGDDAAAREIFRAVAGGRGRASEPGPDDAPAVGELIGLFHTAAGHLGIPEQEGAAIALAWFDVDHWVNLMITVMGKREFRHAAGLLPEAGGSAAQLGDSVPRAHWLAGLAQVLDDEPIVVIDHATGRRFRLL